MRYNKPRYSEWKKRQPNWFQRFNKWLNKYSGI